MKIKIVIFLKLGLLSIGCLAIQNGSINFVGAVTDRTCILDDASSNQVIRLGNISTSAFKSAGQVASPTPFSVLLKDCPLTAKTISIKFSGVSNTANPTVLSLDNSSSAVGVGIAIYKGDSGTFIPLYSDFEYDFVNNNSGEIRIDFVAKYMATSIPVKPGNADSRVDFIATYR